MRGYKTPHIILVNACYFSVPLLAGEGSAAFVNFKYFGTLGVQTALKTLHILNVTPHFQKREVL